MPKNFDAEIKFRCSKVLKARLQRVADAKKDEEAPDSSDLARLAVVKYVAQLEKELGLPKLK